MKRGLLLVIALIVMPFVSAQANSCFVATNCSDVSLMPNPAFTYVNFGYVSMQGHYSKVQVNDGFSYTFSLCCSDAYTWESGDVSFRVSTIDPPFFNGSGHVQSKDIVAPNFPGEVRVGADCNVKASCDDGETCLFKMSDSNGSHVMDCFHANSPQPNNYGLSMCCKLTEICYDGIDNDLDGFIDCADADCNNDIGLGLEPESATIHL